MKLRVSGILATLAFVVMVASDLLMLTTLDFSRPYRFWDDAARLGGQQVLWGYYLGELALPFYCVGAWHYALAVRPAGRWASWLVFLTTVYASCLFAVWHASFVYFRLLLRVGARQEVDYALSHYARPLFVVGVGLVGVAQLVVLALILQGRTLYPRWALLFTPAVFVVLLYVVAPHASGAVAVFLWAAGWNVVGALSFAASTIILWNRSRGRLTSD